MLRYILIIAVVTSIGMVCNNLSAQQIPTSTYQTLRSSPFNPGSFPSGNLNELHLNVQQRTMGISGFSSATQFLNYANRPIGKKKSFSWGFNLSNDLEHTDSRLAISPRISAKVFEKGPSSFALGISAGILNWNFDYNNRRVYEGGDATLFNFQNRNTIQLDAGVGATYQFSNEKVTANLGGSVLQLASMFQGESDSLIQKDNNNAPHLTLNGNLLYHFSNEIAFGPRIFYRGVIDQSETELDSVTLAPAAVDLGFLLEFPKKDLWVAGSYQTSSQSLKTGFGFRLTRTDTTPDRDLFGSFIDMNFGCSYPLSEAGIFGPTAEIGAKWTFGSKKIIRIKLEKEAQNFWKSDTWMTAHRVDRIDPNGPNELLAEADITSRAVYMAYTFPDFSLRYIGDSPQSKHDTLLYRIGMEWPGIDGLMENIPSETISEALWPDTIGIVDLENLEPLRKLAWIELSSNLRGDEERVHFSSEVIYEGELGTNNIHEDTLFLDIVFNGLDTTLAIRQNAMTTQLELAALKLCAMRKKLEYELLSQYGDEFIVVWEGVVREEAESDYRTPIMIRKPRIIPNNPQMQFLQENKVELKFLRDRKYVKDIESPKENRTLKPSQEEILGEAAKEENP